MLYPCCENQTSERIYFNTSCRINGADNYVKAYLLPFRLVDSVFNGSQNRRYSMCVYRYIQTNIIIHVYSKGHLIKVSWSQPKLTKLI